MKKKDVDEILETLWHLKENNELDMDSLRRHTQGEFNEELVETLELKGYIKVDNDKIQLNKKGEERARGIIRRHRLAERLLVDVLGMKTVEAETGACEFEHIIAPEIVEGICSLLGHPKQCPHGLPIPEGECCKKQTQNVSCAVVSLDKAKVGADYKVAYINTSSGSRIHKLVHFGINPGTHITLHQSYPAFVIKSDNGQLALEESIAKEIYVWKNGNT